MKIYISADLEGVAGVVSYEQTDIGTEAYKSARQQMIREINAAVEGAFAGGADWVAVNDAHDTMINLQPDLLDSRAMLISGRGKPWSMMQGVWDADAVLFLGYHARAGTGAAILDHTYSGKIYRLWVNGNEFGEAGFNAAIAAHFGRPVIFLSGDLAVCAEARQLMPWIETVATKEAITRTSALCLAPDNCCRQIKDKVAECTAKYKGGTQGMPLLQVALPVELKVELVTSEMADLAQNVPGWRRSAGRIMEACCKDIADAAGMFFSLLRLTGAAADRLI